MKVVDIVIGEKYLSMFRKEHDLIITIGYHNGGWRSEAPSIDFKISFIVLIGLLHQLGLQLG